MFIAHYQKIPDKHTELTIELDLNILLFLGVLVGLLQEFLVFKDLVLTDQVKGPTETCVEKVTWLSHCKYGEDGIEKLIWMKRDMPLPLLFQVQLVYLWLLLEVIEFLKFLNFL